MKNSIRAFTAGCLFLFCFAAVYAQPHVTAQLLEDLTVREIAKDVFLITHNFPWPANSLLVRLTRTHFVWADTPYTPEATDMVLRWLFVKYGEGLRITEINTGFHVDNLGGNRELIKNKVPIYGSHLTCDLLKKRSKATMDKMLELLRDPEKKQYYDKYRSFRLYAPTVRFDIRKTQLLKFGNENVEIYYPGPTHTDDNVVVYFPGKRVLFGTCMVLARDAETPGFIEDANMHEWPKSLRKVQERYKRARIVVPGHGEPGDLSLIEHSIKVLEESAYKDN